MSDVSPTTAGRDHIGRVYQPGEIPDGSSVPACPEHLWEDQPDSGGNVMYTYCAECGLRPAE